MSLGPLGLQVSRDYFLNFLSDLYSKIVRGNFHIYGVQISGKCIFESKNWLDFFTYTLQPNISPRLSLSPTNQRKINHSLQVALFRKSVSPSRKRGGREEEMINSWFIFESKNWLDFFTYILQPNISPRLSLSPTNQRKINHSLQVALFRKSVSPSRKGGGREEETVLLSFFYLLNFRLLIHWELKNFRNVFLKSKKFKNLLLQFAHWKLTRLT